MLKADGTVVAWGNNSDGQTTVPAGLSGVVQVSAGYGHMVAVKSDGRVVGWGNNSYQQYSGYPGELEYMATGSKPNLPSRPHQQCRGRCCRRIDDGRPSCRWHRDRSWK